MASFEETRIGMAKVVNEADVQHEMRDAIRNVAEITHLEPGTCHILLHQFKWERQRLLERFYDDSEPDQLLQAAGVSYTTTSEEEKFSRMYDGECGICCSVTSLTGLSCRHMACRLCWEQYLRQKVVDENNSMIECLFPGCQLLIDNETCLRLMGDAEDARHALNRQSVNHFVHSSRLLRWCPAPGCGKAIRADDSDAQAVACECGFILCFECGEEHHEPITCSALKNWQKSCNYDAVSNSWLSANTKQCPKCHATIEKNGGCNHMQCRNSSCGFHFCWVCLGEYVNHGDYYKCEMISKQEQKDQEMLRDSKKRFLEYFNRFEKHQKSRKREESLHSSTKIMMTTNAEMRWAYVQYLHNAFDLLASCRRTLMYSIPFEFYMKVSNENEKVIFELNQRELESTVELLSKEVTAVFEDLEQLHLEKPSKASSQYRIEMKCRYIKHRCNVLLLHCADIYILEKGNC